MRLCAKKKEKKNSSQRRQAAKASGSYTERTIISLRLPTAGRSLRLCAKKNPPRRKAGKMQEPRGGPQFLCGLSADRQALRLCESLIIPPVRRGVRDRHLPLVRACPDAYREGVAPTTTLYPVRRGRREACLPTGRSPWNK